MAAAEPKRIAIPKIFFIDFPPEKFVNIVPQLARFLPAGGWRIYARGKGTDWLKPGRFPGAFAGVEREASETPAIPVWIRYRTMERPRTKRSALARCERALFIESRDGYDLGVSVFGA